MSGEMGRCGLGFAADWLLLAPFSTYSSTKMSGVENGRAVVETVNLYNHNSYCMLGITAASFCAPSLVLHCLVRYNYNHLIHCTIAKLCMLGC